MCYIEIRIHFQFGHRIGDVQECLRIHNVGENGEIQTFCFKQQNPKENREAGACSPDNNQDRNKTK